ncbi:non-oxidative hydroxyarylic acid decarboxylases subunit C [Streptomyces sp. CB02959]|uniref:non-oxidative hydroxyarylic acid decarboxylases subunit C n=1 Tax=Streptomyces sp. CB02959 TaxID=2020330 RepID=UPI000C274442|nr:non-oxidative hydroxyarylic acid decarboxylases subunit C [Streptomyces sp. CB02959]PJN34515.1 phenolic acid decarboxylase [Streptomyces sp. CB02959]
MAYDDLRSFLDTLDKEGQLLRITEEVLPEPDLAAAANATGRIGENAPALYFDNVKGFTDARIAMNVHGSWANHALALGLPRNTSVKEQVETFARRWDAFPVAPERREDAPWRENTQEGDDVDLFSVLPLFRLNDGDGGFYLDKAAVVSRDPEDADHFGKQNVGTYRIQVIGANRLAFQPVPMHDVAQHLRKAEEKGEDLPIAITLGNDPVMAIVAGMPMAYDDSEYEMAGALRGAPAPIATAPLTGFDVPWGSEVVIEGVIESRKRQIEGPFGEFTGHYSGGRRMPVIRVDRVSFRTNPIFESLYLGMPWTECDYLVGPNTCVPLLKQLRAEFPEVKAVNAMYTHGLMVIISTAKRYGGFAKAVGMRAMTTPHGLGYVSQVILVDEDVDPFNLPQVMWAMSAKVNPKDDVVVIPNLSVLELAPAAQPAGITSKMIIDATTPVSPDVRGNFSTPAKDLPETAQWAARLQSMIADCA